jgi:hypothetical protein
MYAHPSFVRDTPETLLHLRKITTTARKRPTAEVSVQNYNSRTVSPLSAAHHHPAAEPTSPISDVPKIIVPKVAQWSTTVYTSAPILPATSADRGKLDLLAMAMEHQAAAH